MAPRKQKEPAESSEEEEEVLDERPPEINPYKVLGLETSCTEDQVKVAYRKAALKYHPGQHSSYHLTSRWLTVYADKAPEHLKSEAHTTFQSIAAAYAVLSDPVRRKRYDTTGSTSESMVDSEGFSWSDFYSEQFKDAISGDAIEKFAKKYKGSDEEKDDIVIAFEKAKGDMAKLYTIVMLSDPEEDEDRFRAIIDAAIKSGVVEAYKAYRNETKAQRKKRIEGFHREGAEAMAYAEKLGVADKLFNRGGKAKGEDSLMALIQKKQQNRGQSFLDQLEAKYAPKAKDPKNKKRGSPGNNEDEPSEAAFQAAAAKLNAGKAGTGAKKAKISKK